MSEEPMPVDTGTIGTKEEIEVTGMSFLVIRCNRCGEKDTGQTIGNGSYCDDCAAAIWENIT